MKKMNLTRKLMAACSIVALSAVMYGCVHSGDDPEPMVEMPDPMPEPTEPAGPTDLEETQTAAADAAAAAMTASDAAAKAADDAATATMYLATLQTGADSNAAEMGGNEHADAARKYAKAAMTASDAAAAASASAASATTAAEAEAAWRMAENAKDDAVKAETEASKHAAAASAAAMSELHIKDALKWAGGIMDDDEGASSVNANADTTTSPAKDKITGFIEDVERSLGAVAGRAYDEATATLYRQAVAARDLKIGKTLDSSDDKARLTVFHSRFTTNDVSVYGIPATRTSIIVRIDSDGNRTLAGSDGSLGTDDDVAAPAFNSLGMHHEASNPLSDPADLTSQPTAADGLANTDVVGAETTATEVFSYTDSGTFHTVETSRIVNAVTGDADVTYMSVDTLAPAAPDAHGIDDDFPGGPSATETDENPEQIRETASIPVAELYSHIHFGIWAGLGPAAKDGSQKVANLGIGFVQNFSGSGKTDRLGIGTVSYNGDWVAAVQKRNRTAGAGAIILDNNTARLVADFDEQEFTATLNGLATLEGTIAGNGFSGITAKAITHDDLNSDGTFVGEFSGGIYGPAGTEAAGVFDFDGKQNGAFRGAFGGTNQ